MTETSSRGNERSWRREARPWIWPVAMVVAWMVLNAWVIGRSPLDGCLAGACPTVPGEVRPGVGGGEVGP